jgi:hypothetical protein
MYFIYLFILFLSFQLHISKSQALWFKQTNSVALVGERTIQNERPWLIGEVSANFCG